MALINHIEHPDYSILLWHITEDEKALLEGMQFSALEAEELAQIKANKARLSWIACRKMIKEILHTDNVFLVKDTFGKPFIEGSNKHISISHSHEYAAVMISPFSCGIDVHKLETRIEQIAPKFINTEEWLTISNPNEKLNKIHLFWSAKESLYKYYGRKQLDFKAHMQIAPFDLQNSGMLHASIQKDDYLKNLNVFYQFEENYVFTYTFG